MSITYREVEFLLGECFVLSDAFRELHNGWAIAVDVRCSQLLADADAAGLLDWSLRGSIEVVQELLSKRVGGLPVVMRLLDDGDVTLTAGARMPDDWWTQVTVASLVRRDSDSAVLWQFRACAAYSLTLDERNATGGKYEDLIDMLGRNAVAGYDNQSNSSVAAMVAKLMRTTRFPEGMYVYVPAAEAAAEISRRISATEAERFSPVFEVRWRNSSVFHKPCGGSVAYDLASTLATQLSLGQPLTKPVADAVEAVSKKALPPRVAKSPMDVTRGCVRELDGHN